MDRFDIDAAWARALSTVDALRDFEGGNIIEDLDEVYVLLEAANDKRKGELDG